ncbi:MAG: hypothetical protein RIA69_05000 [Cyclobacteriaceae bacterium]
MEKENKVEEPFATYGMSSSITAIYANFSVEEISKAPMTGATLSKIQENTSLSAQTLTAALEISKSKYYDMLQSDKLDFKTKDALVDLAYLWEKGMEAFDDNQDNLIEWLNAKNDNLGGIKPVVLFGSRTGRRELEKAFLRIEYSIYG